MEETFSIRDRILQTLQTNQEQGVSQDVLLKNIEGVNMDHLLESLNELLREGRIWIYQSPKSPDPVYKFVPPEELEKLKGLAQDQLLIYRLIEGAQRDGIWMRTLKLQSKLQSTQINKAIKILEQKKLVKSFKSVLAKTKKYYILYDLQPAPEHRGGVWYGSDLEFDRGLVNMLTEDCYQYTLSKGRATVEDMRNYIKYSKHSPVDLQEEDIQKLVDSLVYEGRFEIYGEVAGQARSKTPAYIYRALRVMLPSNGFTSTPCGTCPVFHLCTDEGDISPSNCDYMKEWLDY